MNIGAHLSIAGGYHKALERLAAIGGNCLQIFSASPRGWNKATLTEESKQLFLEMKKKLRINDVFFHASYLVNLADEGRIGTESKKSLVAELKVASQLGIVGSIVHTGSFKGNSPSAWSMNDKKYAVLIHNIKEVLDNSPHDAFLILENAGNKKIGQNIEELASIIRDVKSYRLKICLDTCHLFSAGYELSSQQKLKDFLDEFKKKIGLDRLLVLHVNDSRDPFNSGRDRHENIGQGTLGMEPFVLLINNSSTKNLPFIIETPGFDGKVPDKKNMDILKSLV